MAGVYSARFMIGRGGNRRETYHVPAGKRAVVRYVAAYRWGDPNQSSAFAYVHGIPILYFPPGSSPAFQSEVRYVAYQGETLEMILVGADWSYGMFGFIFSDPNGRPDDADNTITPVALKDVPRPLPQWRAG